MQTTEQPEYFYYTAHFCLQLNRYIYFCYTAHFCLQLSSMRLLVTIRILLVIKALKEKALALKEAFVVKLYGSCLSIVCLHHLYIVYQLSGRIEYIRPNTYITTMQH